MSEAVLRLPASCCQQKQAENTLDKYSGDLSSYILQWVLEMTFSSPFYNAHVLQILLYSVISIFITLYYLFFKLCSGWGRELE